MPNIRLVIEYDGAAFHGWQMQRGVRSVESELERALGIVLRCKIHPLYASGRTDAGVHARAQVLNFHVADLPDLRRLSLAVSGILRGKLSVLQAEVAPDDFHARYDAVSKQYSYHILNRACPPALDKGKVWYIPRRLDVELMRREAKVLEGQHDFSSFRCSGCMARDPVKNIFESELQQHGDLLIYRVIGSGFLKQMVRTIVGTLVGLSDGMLDLKSMQEVLDVRDRRKAGITAPACGLYLDWVKYPDL
ncbi:MAG: tRNA pseudouridine(38-40) synthase TruA [Oligoflexia bacterium]|nr:tRNA pseudouridine(38-40) synthase TruA [Oligoflexia bacterium]